MACYSEKGRAATPGRGIGNLPPLIDIVVVSCVVETNVDATPKVINADGAHDKDFNCPVDVAKHDESIYIEASVKGSKATDSIVVLSRCDNNTLTSAPNSNDFENTTCVVVGEKTGMPAKQ